MSPMWIVLWGVATTAIMVYACLKRPVQRVYEEHEHTYPYVRYDMMAYELDKLHEEAKKMLVNDPQFLRELIAAINELQLQSGLSVEERS